MNNYEQQKLELEFRDFTSRNFEKPAKCRNSEQIRFYIAELCTKIEDYQSRFEFVPNCAYALLAQYNERQNMLVVNEFRTMYTL